MLKGRLKLVSRREIGTPSRDLHCDCENRWIVCSSNTYLTVRRHLRIKRPALEMLLQQIEQHPETTGLKRLLAVKKSLLEFEQRVEFVVRVVQQLVQDEEVGTIEMMITLL